MENQKSNANGQFPETNITLFDRMNSAKATESTVAREEFFKAYWYPLYVFLRGQGDSHHNAADTVQDFILKELITGEQLIKWDSERGQLRTFLKTILDRFRKNQFRRETAQKRGGPERLHNHLPIDLDWAKSIYEKSACDNVTPADLFAREWATAVVDRVTKSIAAKYSDKGKQNEFKLLLRNIYERDTPDGPRFKEIAESLKTSPSNVKKKMTAFKAIYEKTLRRAVQETVHPAEVDEEIRFILSSLAKPTEPATAVAGVSA